MLDGLIERHAAERVLVGVDFPLGYPAGTAAALGLAGAPWVAMWGLLTELVRDDASNRNNRFEVASRLNERIGADAGPFWGCPASQVCSTLTSRKPVAPGLPEWRQCEQALRRSGHRPASVWQLSGAGSVGSQTLVGIPVISRLRTDHIDRVEVWPLTTGSDVGAVVAARPAVVFAEVWPAPYRPDLTAHPVRDAAQVRHVVAQLAAHDARGTLAGWFAVSGPAAVAEEAAILSPRA